ncbi:MAG TPA: transketolase [bacterium]|uniref:Transketolase n=1 Tax=candidate division TA06 bacterium ADurb.Bin417 TaxID=1852828 RepID=A0A1V5MLE2_UNCT6|nr:MAG: Transketolase [candidate division TA06 bacterium ADurb.Bin417]HNQ34443.1 transketolase [bacterium]HNS48147.1 transketolase [bacterium]
MIKERFAAERLSDEQLRELAELSRVCKGDILKMTTLAACGHPGGSISSLDLYLVLFKYAAVDPGDPDNPNRDHILISHGHTSPGAYATLGRLGFFSIEAAVSGFRKIDTPFEGHVVRELPGLDWSSGNLGQGLSAGCGFALASRILKRGFHVFVAMSDGEHAKGQIAESRRFAAKYGLDNLTVVIDYNHIQISGKIEDVMPQNIKGNYLADGWRVLEVDGHDHQAIYQACREAASDGKPTVILAETVMSRGISFMEGLPKYHGAALKPDDCRKALAELGLEDDLDRLGQLRKNWSFQVPVRRFEYPVSLNLGEPVLYPAGSGADNRGAFGKALLSIASASCGSDDKTPLVVVDCDLATSVRTEDFAKLAPCSFYEAGVQEHTAATLSGALSASGVVVFFADFGAFGVDETYNQERLNDLNHTNLKLVSTHCGLDVGEDGKTHQCIDYLGLFNNLFGFKVIVPADPNQTDRAVRYMAGAWGNFLMTMGRSKVPVVTREDGTPYYDAAYRFEYGQGDWIRRGRQATVVCMGAPMTAYAVAASDQLRAEGVEVGVLNLASPLQPDIAALREAAATGCLLTLEDHHIRTGLGAVVANFLAENRLAVKFQKLGIKGYGQSGTPEALYAKEGIDTEGIKAAVKKLLAVR